MNTLEQLRRRYPANYITAEQLLQDHLTDIPSVRALLRQHRTKKIDVPLTRQRGDRGPWVVFLPQLAEWLDAQAAKAA
ncbi:MULTISPECIES: pyocin activator PrtN family protein [unclassified Pseudomonas]|uniref:pyocin activator PrtN family protein n=1 Tax=unclassified Pseudomonas TaxID=196821 RepID=UPI002449CBE3|nr:MULTISPECIES: pyocin activator PrtN family protein [unclassified Pseudomonas]MDG9928505.1 pyocin activator PrtN family protein [Pseudomonas sp. GD04042]MDH0482675.1 pyocin activator PrtN family protein [Pseudomonas sp. GD04015]MDH0604623.1 pyocin activator PrtN family protein [Pseudomonas sp. GD03869]MDH0894251.1 pyocin activator PrtN family protein [Pseudomonas sp. GD03875]MDH1063454.1 pyocin activator PrtN family protein [Pseudomonas sp. GD03985]